MPSSDVSPVTEYLLVRIVRLLRGDLTGHPRGERESPSDFLLGDEIHDVSKRLRVFVPTRFRELAGLWVNRDAPASPFLVILPKRLDGILWETEDGLDWSNEVNGFALLVLVAIVLRVLVVVGAIDDLF